MKQQRRKKSGGFIALIVLLVLIVIGFALVGGAYLYMKSDINGTGKTPKDVTLVVEQGTSPARIAAELKENGLIKSDLIFRQYLKKTGADKKLQYGTFELQVGMSYEELIAVLQTTYKDVDTVKITLPEGTTVYDMGKIVEAAGFGTREEFWDIANNGDFSDIPFFAHLDYDPNTFMKAEGYLFPKTYEFYPEATVEDIVRKLYQQFNLEITDEMYARMDELGMSLREVITLASLIQEEAGDPANQPGVSGVFHNRLKEGSPYPKMGSDVTWYYIADFIRPYYGGEANVPAGIEENYYTGDEDPNSRIGLPAGPLSNPGHDAIHAALYPEEHNYYFFLTDLTGKYYYAETYDGHLANVAEMKRVNATIKQ